MTSTDHTMRAEPPTAPEWLSRPNGSGYWWLRDGDKPAEIVRVNMLPWDGDAFEFYGIGSEIEVHSREIGTRNPVRWQRVAPPGRTEGT